MNVKRQLSEFYGIPYRNSSTFLLLKRWQKKKKESLKRLKERKNKEKE